MRTLAMACMALLLSACGFRPLHTAASQGLPANLGPLADLAIDVRHADNSEDRRMAFLIQEALQDRLPGSPSRDALTGPRYQLRVTPTVDRAGLGVGTDDIASRFDLNVFARWELWDGVTGDRLARDQVFAVSTFGAPLDPFGRIAAEVDASEQAAEEAANLLINDLAVWFAGEERREREERDAAGDAAQVAGTP